MLYEDMKLELNIKCSGSASMMKVAEIIGGTPQIYIETLPGILDLNTSFCWFIEMYSSTPSFSISIYTQLCQQGQ